MTKQMRNNLIKLVAFSAAVLMLAIVVEYKWDFFASKNINSQFQAQIVTAPGGPGASSTGAGAAPELDPLPDWIFSDVASSHTNARAIYELKKREIMQGRSDGTFRPDQVLLKVETLVLSMRAANIEVDENLPANPLNDVQDKTQWFYPYVNTAYHKGIIIGDKNGNFNPIKNTNLAEYLVMTMGATMDLDLSEYEGSASDPWYTTYANYAEQNGLIDGKFVANQEVSRSFGSEILWRLLLLLGRF